MNRNKKDSFTVEYRKIAPRCVRNWERRNAQAEDINGWKFKSVASEAKDNDGPRTRYVSSIYHW